MTMPMPNTTATTETPTPPDAGRDGIIRLPPLPGTSLGTTADRRVALARHRRRTRLLRRGLLALAVLAAATMLALALRPRPLPVDLAPVAHKAMQVTLDATGETRVKERYLVSAPVAGRLGRVTLTPGDEVAAGDEVARLGPPPSPLLDPRTRGDAEARLAAARVVERQARAAATAAGAVATQAAREADRTGALARDGAVTPREREQADLFAVARVSEWNAAELAVEVAAEEVRRALATLAKADAGAEARATVIVRSPVAGRVLRVLQKSAGVVAAATPLLEIGDLASLEVVADVLTSEAVDLRLGAPAVVEIAANADVAAGGHGATAPLAAHVVRIEPGAFTRVSALGIEEKRTNVVLALDQAPPAGQTLGDGFRVEARIVRWRTDRALVAPASAVFRHGDGWAVYRLGEGQRAELTVVTPRQRNATEVALAPGLPAGAELVLFPGDRLTPGVRLARRPR